MEKNETKIRLDRLCASQLNDISRKDVKKLCAKGLVTVNGNVVKDSNFRVSAEDEIIVNGKKINYKKHIYIMLNKPAGYVCSTRDGKSPTVLELVPPEMMRKGLFPAGRLDKDTEGFVLLTDDGELAHNMLSPKKHVCKEYFVRLEKPWENSYKQAFEKGMEIDGGEKCLPAEFVGNVENKLECNVILREGKFHQIKRMFASLGNKVVFLRRISIGNLPLDPDLPLGSCLEIMHKDVEKMLTNRRSSC